MEDGQPTLPPAALSGAELIELVRRVFLPGPEDRSLAVLVDLPDARQPDHPAWRERRALAAAWASELAASAGALGLEQVTLVLYPNVGRNNADLPGSAWLHAGGPLPERAEELAADRSVPFALVLDDHRLLLAPTEFSATAPLKMAAIRHGFRAATMPGFSAAMVPALRLDYGEVARRVERLRTLLDQAQGARLRFAVRPAPAAPEGTAQAAGEELALFLDLRHRQAHASTGLLPQPGTAGNLPSGEAYIVPYEGELPGDPSRSEGLLPVQLGDEVVLYTIEGNVAVGVEGEGPAAAAERALLQAEPAYGNLAELGLGVLGDLGVAPCGELLLDEKLGLHIAFGRSEHFGGQVGPSRFSRPEAVVHLDRVYLPATQPRVEVVQASLLLPDGSLLTLIERDRWVLDWSVA